MRVVLLATLVSPKRRVETRPKLTEQNSNPEWQSSGLLLALMGSAFRGPGPLDSASTKLVFATSER